VTLPPYWSPFSSSCLVSAAKKKEEENDYLMTVRHTKVAADAADAAAAREPEGTARGNFGRLVVVFHLPPLVGRPPALRAFPPLAVGVRPALAVSQSLSQHERRGK